ncbi:MAG: hypothetical protein ACJ748_10960 [Flavisolibacter sp.]
MEDLLTDFEQTGIEYKKIRSYILSLSNALVFIFFVSEIYYIAEDNFNLNWGVLIFTSFLVLLVMGSIFLFAKGNQLGWYFLLLIYSVLLGFFIKIGIQIITGTWANLSVFRVGIVIFITLDSSISIFLLYYTVTRKFFEIRILYSVIWAFICSLAIYTCYMIS